MSNEYNSAQGGAPVTCYGSAIPPNLGTNSPSAPGLSLNATPMVTVANPFQPCAPSPPICSAPSCCGPSLNGGPPIGGGVDSGAQPFA
jgi:hypothetical protein